MKNVVAILFALSLCGVSFGQCCDGPAERAVRGTVCKAKSVVRGAACKVKNTVHNAKSRVKQAVSTNCCEQTSTCCQETVVVTTTSCECNTCECNACDCGKGVVAKTVGKVRCAARKCVDKVKCTARKAKSRLSSDCCNGCGCSTATVESVSVEAAPSAEPTPAADSVLK